MDYLDFELEIGGGRGRDYPVAVIRSPAGEAREEMRFPFDQLALENRLKDLQIALLRSGVGIRRVPSTEEQAVQNFGRDLFNAITAGEVRSRYDVSLREARQQKKGLRLKLRILSSELSALPWEFLYDERQGEYLCLSETTPVVRYLELPQPIQPLSVVLPLRLLGMIASPSDLPILDVDRERERIERAIAELQTAGKLELTWVPGATWRDLQRMMRKGSWHIFHFIGHGGFDSRTEEGLIAFSDDEGRANLLSATQVVRLLADHHALRLVVLNACEGAKGSERDVFSSTAAIFVRRGIPAVIAMQHEITDKAAIEFSRSFYEVLADGRPIDAAVTSARVAINLAVNNSLEWGTPVLYMRSPDGVLFEPSWEPGKMGRLFIETEPENASVKILNISSEYSQGMGLEPGRYHVEVSAEGYETEARWIQLRVGEEARISFRLVRKTKARLLVETEPTIASVKILNIPSEYSQGMGLEPGRYHVEVSAEGYKTEARWIELRAGEESRISFRLVRKRRFSLRIAVSITLSLVIAVGLASLWTDIEVKPPLQDHLDLRRTPPSTGPSGILKPLILRASADPSTVTPGRPTRITVTAQAENGSPLQGAQVEVQADGGTLFLMDRSRVPAPGSLRGVTDQTGSFTVWWQCDRCANSHQLSVKAKKLDYANTETKFFVTVMTTRKVPPRL